MRKTIFIMSVFFLFMASSCKGFYQESFNISDEESITLQLPSWPPEDKCKSSYPPLAKWIIYIQSEQYSASVSWPANVNSPGSEKHHSAAENIVSVSGNNIIISVKKNRPLAITVHPVTKGICNENSSGKNEILFFKPAGFLYPYDFKTGKNNLNDNKITWNHGFTASLMQNIFKNENYPKSELNKFISHFNWNKASEILDKKINDESKPYNPWLLNQTRLMEKICSRKASAIYFNLSSTENIALSSLPFREKNIPEPSLYLSSFIPENKNITATNKILIKKQQPALIYTEKNKGIMCTYYSINKISLEYILLPIYIEGI